MCKKPLQDVQMSGVAFVERAAWWSRELTRFRARGPGDLENAMRSIERDYGISYGTIWSLRYRLRQFKDIGVGIYSRIESAYQAECERQLRKLKLETEITAAKVGANHPVVVAAQAVVDGATAGRGGATAGRGDASRVPEDDR